jgi:hypothetical protein
MIAFDRVAQYITSVGTDEVMSLGTAVPTYITAAAAAAIGSISGPWPVPYLIMNGDGAGWELGLGSISATGFLSRSKVFRSSNSGARISVTDDPNSPIVYVVQLGLGAAAVTHSQASDDPFSGLDPALGSTVASGAFGAVGLGSQSRVDANGGTALGVDAYSRVEEATALGALADARVIGAVSSGVFDAANVVWVGSAQTFDDSPALIARNGIGMVPWATGVYTLDVLVSGRRTSPSAAAYGARITGVVMRTAGGTPVIVGTPTTTDIALTGGATATCALVIDGDNNAVTVEVTGGASDEWMWSASIRAAEQAGF